jgi:signal transduction histidine kinase
MDSPEITRVLLIEDEPEDVALARRSLAGPAAPRFSIEDVATLEAGIDRLGRGDLDVVLLDLRLPDSGGVDTVVRLRERDPTIPIVVFTVTGDDRTAVAALAAGAEDYLVKEEISGSLLRRTILHARARRRIAREDRRALQRLHEVEKIESLGALCGGLGFGFNTLIGTIFDRCDRALASLLARESALSVRTDLLEIHRAAFRAGEMVQRLRDYAALERSAEGAVDLAHFTLDAMDFLSTLVSHEIDIACDASIRPIWVQVARPVLHRLLLSLVVNAAEAIGNQPGSISISTGHLEVDEELLEQTHGWPDPRPGVLPFLRVADDGRGLDAASRERIFDPFYTTKSAGRGLGLSSVLGILHRHRAVVHIDDRRPAGAVFTVLFPGDARLSPASARATKPH